MAKSKQGGAFGFLRGKVASVSYSVLPGSATKSGKKEQIVRSLPESVSNPQSVAQCMQRMKLAPAIKFYNAFAELLSNAFQGVGYGEESRRYFLKKAMKEEGPYIQKGVDRFIPAKYPFSEGSISSVPVEPFSGGATNITLGVTSEEATITPEILAAALGVSTDYQITIAVVNNNNGLFEPDYIGYDDRMKIADLPAAAIGKDTDGKITLDMAALGLNANAVVAQVVVLSIQDASGSWLRSTQNMVISNELSNSLYSVAALNAALNSYRDTTTTNAINSEWYYNLGLSQAYNGKLTVANGWKVVIGGVPQELGTYVLGIRQNNGTVIYSMFVDDVENPTKLAKIIDGVIVLDDLGADAAIIIEQIREGGNVIEKWNNAYATQLGYMMGEVGGDANTPVYWRKIENANKWVLVDGDGKAISLDGANEFFFSDAATHNDIGCSDDASEIDGTGAFVTAWGVTTCEGNWDGPSTGGHVIVGNTKYEFIPDGGFVTMSPEAAGDFQ